MTPPDTSVIPVIAPKCQSCDGAGYVIQDEEPCHMSCGECAGTGNGLVVEAARGIQDAFWVTLKGPESCKYARKRRETIARYVASAVGAQERSER